MQKKYLKKTIFGIATTTILCSTLAPSSLALAQVQDSSKAASTVRVEPEIDLNSEQKRFEDLLSRQGIDDVKSLSEEDGNKLLEEYANLLDRQRIGPLAAASAVASLVWVGINIGRSFYSAGRYAASQSLSRRWTTRAAYRRNSTPYWIALSSISFWSALGFDDYMYGR